VIGAYQQNREQDFIDLATQNRQPSAENQQMIADLIERTNGNPTNDQIRDVGLALQGDVYESRNLMDYARDSGLRGADIGTLRWMIGAHYLNNPVMDVMSMTTENEERYINAEPEVGG